MKKFYRVLKETALWEKGAIISGGDGDSYRPVDPVFVKDIDGVNESWNEGAAAVENQPEWFERVYEMHGLKKMAYGTKKQAQAAAAALYEGDKKAK